jgi:toxin-antitoxin system PIN domain toxin
VILVDANLLIYAIDADSPHHAQSRRWLEETLSGDTSVGLPWLVVLAFVRITTRAGIMRNPLSPEQAVGFVDEWLAQPYVVLVGPSENHWAVLRNLLLATGTAGNLTSDAHLAALAIEHGCEIASADNDFLRFQGVVLVNPLAGE